MAGFEPAGGVPLPLRMYGQPSDVAPLPWEWVDAQLAEAGTYWVTGRSPGHPHPRPVWGIWMDGSLSLTVGSTVLGRQIGDDPRVTVHLDSGTDVVIVEGRHVPVDDHSDIDRFLDVYQRKYDYTYTLAEYGPPRMVAPTTVMAWRSAGWAGREGFRQVGKWGFAG